MAPGRETSMTLHGPEATDRLAERLAGALGAGDAVLLSGPIGAGKTHLARGVIRALWTAAGEPPEDVPSPTYTLVQTYRAGPLEIWHADLYRLSGPAEAWELGLEEAFETALCLVEWPDRLGAGRPADALDVELAHAAEGAARTVRIAGPARLLDRLDGIAA